MSRDIIHRRVKWFLRLYIVIRRENEKFSEKNFETAFTGGLFCFQILKVGGGDYIILSSNYRNSAVNGVNNAFL